MGRLLSALNTLLLALATVTFVLGAVLDVVGLMIFGFLFDAPSSDTALAPLLLLAMLAYPVTVVVGMRRLWNGDSPHGALAIPLAGACLVVGSLLAVNSALLGF